MFYSKSRKIVKSNFSWPDVPSKEGAEVFDNKPTTMGGSLDKDLQRIRRCCPFRNFHAMKQVAEANRRANLQRGIHC